MSARKGWRANIVFGVTPSHPDRARCSLETRMIAVQAQQQALALVADIDRAVGLQRGNIGIVIARAARCVVRALGSVACPSAGTSPHARTPRLTRRLTPLRGASSSSPPVGGTCSRPGPFALLPLRVRPLRVLTRCVVRALGSVACPSACTSPHARTPRLTRRLAPLRGASSSSPRVGELKARLEVEADLFVDWHRGWVSRSRVCDRGSGKLGEKSEVCRAGRSHRGGSDGDGGDADRISTNC